MHLDNNWYGHRSILLKYCGLADRPIFASLQHGWQWKITPQRSQRRLKSAPDLVWNARHQRQSNEYGAKNTMSIGAPFIYFAKMKSLDDDKAAGTLYFPQHSTSKISDISNHSLIIKFIEANYPSPYTVSLFYMDAENGLLYDVYKNSNWHIEVTKTRNDPLFLFNFMRVLEKSEYIISNSFVTSLFYAAFLGKNVQLLRDFVVENSVYAQYADDAVFCRLAQRLFSGVAGSEARSLGSYELGLPFMQSPEQLSETLGIKSAWRPLAAQIVSRMVDMKYGVKHRRGDQDI